MTRPTDLEGIKNPSTWPHWPFLPLVWRGGGQPRVGVLTVASEGYLFAPGVNLWSRLSDAQFTPCDPEQLLAEGWEVD